MHPRKRMKVTEIDEDDITMEENSQVLQIKDSVYFYAEVKPETILKLLSALDKATQYAQTMCYNIYDARVYLYINSCGGDAYCGLSAMDHIRLNPVPIVTVADGYVASAATLILLGGTERKVLSNAKILIHQLSTQFWGKFKDLLDEVANSKELMRSFKKIYGSYTSMKKTQIDELLQKELHMNDQQALKNGFVDEIL